jgi:hypothetical protein
MTKFRVRCVQGKNKGLYFAGKGKYTDNKAVAKVYPTWRAGNLSAKRLGIYTKQLHEMEGIAGTVGTAGMAPRGKARKAITTVAMTPISGDGDIESITDVQELFERLNETRKLEGRILAQLRSQQDALRGILKSISAVADAAHTLHTPSQRDLDKAINGEVEEVPTGDHLALEEAGIETELERASL